MWNIACPFSSLYIPFHSLLIIFFCFSPFSFHPYHHLLLFLDIFILTSYSCFSFFSFLHIIFFCFSSFSFILYRHFLLFLVIFIPSSFSSAYLLFIAPYRHFLPFLILFILSLSEFSSVSQFLITSLQFSSVSLPSFSPYHNFLPLLSLLFPHYNHSNHFLLFLTSSHNFLLFLTPSHNFFCYPPHLITFLFLVIFFFPLPLLFHHFLVFLLLFFSSVFQFLLRTLFCSSFPF